MFTEKLTDVLKCETYSIEILYFAFILVFLYLIFLKANEKGWKAFIPIYNIYVLFKISKKEKTFWYFLILFIVMLLLPIIYYVFNIGNNVIGGTFVSLQVVCFGIMVLIAIDMLISLSEAFGHSPSFVIGFIVFPLIFMGIIALDKSEYKITSKKSNNNKKKKTKKDK